jgi:hypothetical protein
MSWGCEGEASLVAQCSNSYPRPITAVRLKGSEDGYLTLGTKNENKKSTCFSTSSRTIYPHLNSTTCILGQLRMSLRCSLLMSMLVMLSQVL